MALLNLSHTIRLAGELKTGGTSALEALCRELSIPYYRQLPSPKLPEHIAGRIDVGWARKNKLAPISGQDDRLVVAVSNPLALDGPDQLAFFLGLRVDIVGAPEEEVLEALNFLFTESMDTADDVIREMTDLKEGSLEADLEAAPDLIDSSDAAPVIRLVNRILYQAANDRVSDIHIEPAGREAKVRFRIDGVLYDRLSPPIHYLPFLVSRIKVMAGLDIAEKRLPQDGRFHFTVAERSIDVRVSVIPTAGGERLVLRLLDKATAVLGLEDLGMITGNLKRFSDLIMRPHGIILSTGPTGSGKTTTLYAALSRLNNRQRNIITIEDPVEYQPARGGSDSRSTPRWA